MRPIGPLVAAATWVVGCSGSGSSNGHDGGAKGGGSSADCNVGAACTLLTPLEVNQALGTSYAAGSGSPGDVAGQTSSCLYSDASLAVGLQVVCLPETQGPSDYIAYEQAQSGFGFACTPVSGIGDAAFWCVATADGGLTLLGDNLLFFSGSVFATLDVGEPDGGLLPTDEQAAVEQLAKIVVSRL